MDKIPISIKKQVLSVRKLSPAHSQVFWWNYSKVTLAIPSVLHFLSELHGRAYCAREEVIYSANVITKSITDKLLQTLSSKCWYALVSLSGLIESSLKTPILEHHK